MHRRIVPTLVTFACLASLVATPGPAAAQPATKIVRVGYLTTDTAPISP
jgi:hypothetical protein